MSFDRLPTSNPFVTSPFIVNGDANKLYGANPPKPEAAGTSFKGLNGEMLNVPMSNVTPIYNSAVSMKQADGRFALAGSSFMAMG
jgi:hypothetical protein